MVKKLRTNKCDIRKFEKIKKKKNQKIKNKKSWLWIHIPKERKSEIELYLITKLKNQKYQFSELIFFFPWNFLFIYLFVWHLSSHFRILLDQNIDISLFFLFGSFFFQSNIFFWKNR